MMADGVCDPSTPKPFIVRWRKGIRYGRYLVVVDAESLMMLRQNAL